MPAVVAPVTPDSPSEHKSKKKHKSKDKDRSERKKHSKKRTREEHDDEDVDDNLETSPAKRTKTVPSTAKPYTLPAINRDGYSSPIFTQTASFYLSLSPICQRYPTKGLCAEHLSPLLLTYYPPLDGVVLAYQNVSVSEHPPSHTNTTDSQSIVPLARTMDEYAVSFVWVTAEFVLLRLKKGMYLDATINLQNESHLGLVCWNLFNVSISKNRLPKDWKWREPGSKRWRPNGAVNGTSEHDVDQSELGHFEDGSNEKIPETLSLKLRDWNIVYSSSDSDRGILVMEGSLLSDKEDREMDEVEKKDPSRQTRPRQGTPQVFGAGPASILRRGS